MKGLHLTSCLLILLSSGCSESSPPLENSAGKEVAVTYPPDQQVSFELDLNADAGYQWDYDISDMTVVKLDSTSYRSKNGRREVGGLTVETFFFKTLNTGQCTITLRELRGWQRNVAPIHSVRYQVNVRQ